MDTVIDELGANLIWTKSGRHCLYLNSGRMFEGFHLRVDGMSTGLLAWRGRRFHNVFRIEVLHRIVTLSSDQCVITNYRLRLIGNDRLVVTNKWCVRCKFWGRSLSLFGNSCCFRAMFSTASSGIMVRLGGVAEDRSESHDMRLSIMSIRMNLWSALLMPM